MSGGATMVRAGWLTTGKMVIYPIRDAIDAEGRQLLNWVFEIQSETYRSRRDWNLPGKAEDVLPLSRPPIPPAPPGAPFKDAPP